MSTVSPGEIVQEIKELITQLDLERLVLDSNTPRLVGPERERLVTWKTGVGLGPILERPLSLAFYKELVETRDFSFLLRDGSLFQISYLFHRSDIIKHRLWFLPGPFEFGNEDLVEFGLADLIESAQARDLQQRFLLRGPIRFDYDRNSGKRDHPASHLTVASSSCRVPVAAPLSFGHFVRFIFRHFYPSIWTGNEKLRNWKLSRLTATITEEDRRVTYVVP